MSEQHHTASPLKLPSKPVPFFIALISTHQKKLSKQALFKHFQTVKPTHLNGTYLLELKWSLLYLFASFICRKQRHQLERFLKTENFFKGYSLLSSLDNASSNV